MGGTLWRRRPPSRPRPHTAPRNGIFGLQFCSAFQSSRWSLSLVVALLNPNGLLRPDFGYDQWLPASVQADQRGR